MVLRDEIKIYCLAALAVRDTRCPVNQNRTGDQLIYSQSLYQLSYNRDCTIRESNPGRVDGNDPWYHYTNGALSNKKKKGKVATWIEHVTTRTAIVRSAAELYDQDKHGNFELKEADDGIWTRAGRAQ